MSQATSTRWIRLVLGLIAMMSISSPQYVWTLFTKSFQDNLHTNLPAVQVTFSIVIVLQTWLSPSFSRRCRVPAELYRRLVLISHAWRRIDGAQFYKRAMETALPFRRRREVGVTAMFKQTGARGKNLIKRQSGLL
jgi:hypothetical protein